MMSDKMNILAQIDVHIGTYTDINILNGLTKFYYNPHFSFDSIILISLTSHFP
jgi:hypothetical protein